MPDNPVVLPEVGPTGAANITIPLWDIKARGITIPLYLNYVTTGIRVNDISSQVGLGWTINTGPVITRSVNGLADETLEADPGHDWFSLDPLSISCKLDSLRNYFEGDWDFGPDIFSFSLSGESGSFLFDNSGVMHYTNPVTSSIQVDWNGYCPGFSATDAQGNAFIFRATETTSTTTSRDLVSNHTDDGLGFLAPRNTTNDGERVTRWGPDRIVTAMGDTVEYKYSSYYYSTDEYLLSTSYAYYNKPVCPPEYIEPLHEEYWKVSVDESFTVMLVDSIIAPDVFIVFDYEDNQMLSNFRRELVSIEIIERFTGERIALYNFGNGNYQGDSRLRLDTLEVSGPATSAESIYYTFLYEPGNLTTIGHHAQDYYGFQNGNQVEHMLPVLNPHYSSRDLEEDFEYDEADRNIDTGKIKIGVLKRITNPFGGRIDFEYEPNTDTISAGTIRQAPGLRIRSLKAYDSEGSIIQNIGINYSGLNGFYYLTNPALSNPNGVYFYYTQGGGEATPFQSYYTFTSTPVSRLMTGLPGGFYYEEMTRNELDPLTAEAIQFTTDTYTGGRVLRSNRPELLSRVHYDRQEKVVKEENYSHVLYRDTTIYGLRHGLSYYFIGTYNECGSTQVTSANCPYGSLKMYFEIDTIPYYMKSRLLNEHLITSYNYDQSSDDTLTNTLKVEYDYSDTLPLVSSLTTSHYAHLQAQPHSVELKQLRYPFDYADTVGVASNLVNNNILSRALDSRSYLNGHLTEAKTFSFTETGQPDYEYRYAGTNDTISWDSDSLLQKGFIMELKIDYDTLGNPIKATTVKGDIVTLWGYGNRYQIAEITGVDTDQVFYTGFERGASATRDASLSRTGEYYLVLNGSYQCPAELRPGNYIMTYYWRASSSSPWELITESIQLQQSQYASTNKSSGHIDDLRIYPPGSRITTYTWKPYLGKTSETDTNGTTVFYEYDSHGRLFRILDNRGNIQRTILYNTGR
jgi:YD repeat-containing protein